jgi:hypothetical protein
MRPRVKADATERRGREAAAFRDFRAIGIRHSTVSDLAEGTVRPAMERVGEHPVPAGPLAVRWLAYELEEQRAGVSSRARVRLENAGTAPWRSRGREGVQLAYHWLDPLGNAIVWDGSRTAFPDVVAPGDAVELESPVVAPRPPGSYRLAFDLVEEFRFWFQELGSAPLDLPVNVRPRIDERRLRVLVHGATDPELEAALAAQEEPLVTERGAAVAHLVPRAIPAADWSRLILDAHAEGYAAVGPAIYPESRADRRRYGAWAPGGGRNPRFGDPLLLPSLLEELEPGTHEELPAYEGRDGLFEGRALVRLRSRSGRPRG